MGRVRARTTPPDGERGGASNPGAVPARTLGALSALLGAALLSCATAPETVVVPLGISVSPLEEGVLFGGRAVYAVNAPPDTVRAVLLDFSSYSEYRASIIDAETLSTSEDGGLVVLRLRGLAGIDPRATCRFTVERGEGSVVIRYEMTDRSLVLRALRGSFDLRPVSGDRTLVTQEFLLSALLVDRERLLVDLRADAEAIRARAESRYRGED